MMKPSDFKSIFELTEGFDIEAKSALGRDGRGALPASIWETYSAFANTDGGWILLGVSEERQQLVPVGIPEPEPVLKQLWNGLNNRQLVSANLLSNDCVDVFDENDKKVVVVYVPRAPRQRRPVYLGRNPFEGTYKRNYEGDYRCTESEVRRMLTDAEDRPRDASVLDGFGLKDFALETIRAFRGMCQAAKPGHPFLQGDDAHLLLSLGALQRDRTSGRVQATRAGILLFGEHLAIQEAFPSFFLDYREERNEPGAARWEDRVCNDGTWSGNLIDFYRKVYPKLVSDLKVPFRLSDTGQRIDDTEVHRALREAVANTLSHADYDAPTTPVILKQPGQFIFTNPGRLRLPLDVVLAGGTSDPRNTTIHRAFMLLGVAERAGSGVPKILQAWRDQHWRTPRLDDSFEPEQTRLVLTTDSLLPEGVIDALRERLGSSVDHLSPEGRLVLAAAYLETDVNHQGLTQVLPGFHTRDLTLLLQQLTRQRFLEKRGTGRSLSFRLAGEKTEKVEGQYGEVPPWSRPQCTDRCNDERSVRNGDDSGHRAGESSIHSGRGSEHNASGSALNEAGGVVSEDAIIDPGGLKAKETSSGGIEGRGAADSTEWGTLIEISRPISERRRAPPQEVARVILLLCRLRPLTLEQLGELLRRSPASLRVHYIRPLLSGGRLRQRFPDSPTHPFQAYVTVAVESRDC